MQQKCSVMSSHHCLNRRGMTHEEHSTTIGATPEAFQNSISSMDVKISANEATKVRLYQWRALFVLQYWFSGVGVTCFKMLRTSLIGSDWIWSPVLFTIALSLAIVLLCQHHSWVGAGAIFPFWVAVAVNLPMIGGFTHCLEDVVRRIHSRGHPKRSEDAQHRSHWAKMQCESRSCSSFTDSS